MKSCLPKVSALFVFDQRKTMPNWIIMMGVVLIILAIAKTIKSFFVKAMFYFAAAVLATVMLMQATLDPFFWLMTGVVAGALFAQFVLKRRKKRLKKEKEDRERRGDIHIHNYNPRP